MRCLQCRRAARMIRVPVGHEHSHELSRMTRQLGFERREVARIADAGINENRLTIGTDEQVGVVAAAGHRAGIVRREENRRQHRLKTIADAQHEVGVVPVLAEEIVRVSTKRGKRDRRPPVIAARTLL